LTGVGVLEVFDFGCMSCESGQRDGFVEELDYGNEESVEDVSDDEPAGNVFEVGGGVFVAEAVRRFVSVWLSRFCLFPRDLLVCVMLREMLS
jgi:hypothetical protein